MRLLLTVVAPGAPPRDVAVDTDDDLTIGDLARGLAAALAPVDAHPADNVRPLTLGVPVVAPARPATVGNPGGTGAGNGGADAPALYVGTLRLEPTQPVAHSRVRHGVLVGLGAPVAEALTEPGGAYELRIVSGAGAGTVRRLDVGEYVIGTAPEADVRIEDPWAAPRSVTVTVHADGTVGLTPHADLEGRTRPVSPRRPLPGPIVLGQEERRIDFRARRPGERLPDGTVTVRNTDDVPLVHLERRPVSGPTPWPAGAVLGIGDVLLTVVPSAPPDAPTRPNPQGATLDLNRPPRLLPGARTTEFALPPEPERPEKEPLPLAIMLVPVLMGVAFFAFTQSPMAFVVVLLTPLMVVGSHLSGRGAEKRRYRRAWQEWVVRTTRIQQAALEGVAQERSARRTDFPDPADVLMTAIGPRARLWQRRPTDPDFLVVRVGTADQSSEVTLEDPGRERHESHVSWTLNDVPVTIPLLEAGVTGIAGPLWARTPIVAAILGQLATLHAPADLDIVLLSRDADEDRWGWLRWLPHVRADVGDDELAHVGTDPSTIQRRLGEIGQLVTERYAERAGRQGTALPPPTPLLVVLDGARDLRLLTGVPALLQGGPGVGVLFLCLDDDERLLPEECAAVVRCGPDGTSVRRTGLAPVDGIRPDRVGRAWAERLARAVAPIRDVSESAAEGGVPNSSRLLEVIGLDPPTAPGVAQRWALGGRTSRAVIGEGAQGAFAVDLVRDGPHGLIAGTTGAGKSELLQTLIASLAVENRPDEFNFVLIDYKGGAAFKDCNHLPHTVGMVTDLDAHLTGRALDSLGAELRRRELQLHRADAKDIEDYLAAKAPDDEPMPRLLIVIDEFAALVAELPDFVTGLVDIARRGRSLGVHLLLATQRPAGVVSAEIKSNTNLRIALRVTDGNDSSDVIEANDAAHISKSTPGRAYARLGHSSLVPFQSSRVGGRPRVEGEAVAVDVRPMALASLGTPRPAAVEAEEDIAIPTDLAGLVAAAQEASRTTGIVAPPSPWLPALPELVTLDEVVAAFPSSPPGEARLAVPIGLVDVPAQQRRDVAYVDVSGGGHLAIVGAPRSGRSATLRAVAGAIGRWCSPADVHVYGVDCGNNALLPLVTMPHVGAVVSREQVDRMDRLVTRLSRLVAQRQQELAMAGFADVTEQRRSVPPEQRMPYVVVLFDRWEGFFAAYDPLDGGRLVFAWEQILAEGAGVGITVVMTGDRTLTVGRMSTLLDDKLMLRMVDPSDFSAIGMVAKKVPTSMPEGRGFRAEATRETQVALLAADPAGTAQVAALQAIAREASERYADLPPSARPFRVDVLPARVSTAEALALGSHGPWPATSLPVAIGGDTLGLRFLDALEHGPAALVAGPRRSGRSTVLVTLAQFALRQGWQVAAFTPRISPLRGFAGRPGFHGPWLGTEDQYDVTEALEALERGPAPLLTLVDDVELIGSDGWASDLLEEHIARLRDSGSLLVGAGSPAEMAAYYRGPCLPLKRSGCGVMLAPQTIGDGEMFGATLARSMVGQALPAGGGYLVSAGQLERVQVIAPDPVVPH